MIAGALIALLVGLFGGGGSAGAHRTTPRPISARPLPTAAQAQKLLDREARVKADCRRVGGLRFHCELPDIMGVVDIELMRAGTRFEIRGCPTGGTVCAFRNPRSSHRTVGEESPAEAHASGLLNGGYSGLERVTCAQIRPSYFNCDGTFDGEGIHETVNFDLEVVKRSYAFIQDCRVAALRPETVPLACQRLAWNFNFPQGEALELSRGGIARRG